MSKSHFLFNLLQIVNLLQFTNRYKEKNIYFCIAFTEKKDAKKNQKKQNALLINKVKNKAKKSQTKIQMK